MTSPPPPPIFRGHDLEFSRGIYWMVIALGYGSGLVVGLVIWTTLTRRYHEWFVDTFGRGKKFQKKKEKQGLKNITTSMSGSVVYNIVGSFFSTTFGLVLPSWQEFRVSITCGLVAYHLCLIVYMVSGLDD
ncbi:hypothetical protein RHGRI_003740 [Rhododendron griersonianum]|uniref:Uncharacterized protein n=1 Tax=Rhododendron griersonianum TaxID=479676 RepID=A0AAV6L6Y4_9ERIC|nr:hypothetical protein RHGRI_003740 [Rhododendron griersonianum]